MDSTGDFEVSKSKILCLSVCISACDEPFIVKLLKSFVWGMESENTDLDCNFLHFEIGAVIDADIATERLSQVNRAVKRVIRGL